MADSEILVREILTGGFATFGEHSIECSTARAPWRDLIRVERSRKRLNEIAVVPLWTSLCLVRSDGAMDLGVDGEPMQKVVLRTGDAFMYPQGASVYIRMTQPIDSTCIQISPGLLWSVADDLGRSARLTSYRLAHDEQIERMAGLLEAELNSGCASGRLYGEYLAYAFAAYVIQRYGEANRNPPAAQGGLRNGKLGAALGYIEAHVTRDLSLHELAKAVQLSPFHFSRLFKQSTGLAPHQYVLQMRVQEAKRLLRHTRLDLAEIANRLGFRDQSHFTARFRKLTGATPKRWREGA